MSTMTNSERLLSYIESAKAAIKDVTDDAIGHGDDPLAFVIACFRSQADRVKELLEEKESGACRFNCRTGRGRFEDGWYAKGHDESHQLIYSSVDEAWNDTLLIEKQDREKEKCLNKDGLIPRGLKKSEYKRVSFQKLGRFPTQEEWEEYCESAERREGPPKE